MQFFKREKKLKIGLMGLAAKPIPSQKGNICAPNDLVYDLALGLKERGHDAILLSGMDSSKEIEKVKKRRVELEKKLQVINDLSMQKTGPVEVLDELSMLLPEKAWIGSFTNTGEKVVIDGTAVDNTIIAEFMKRLQGSKHYTDVELVLSQQEGLNHKFVIQCKIKKIQD